MTKIKTENLQVNDHIKIAASNIDKEYFFEGLSTMLQSGMGIIAALGALREEAKTKKIKLLAEFIENEIDDGASLWKTFEKVNLLPKRLLSFIRIGEESGRLAENLEIVINQIQKDKDFKSKLRSALIYPLFVVVVMVVVGLGLAFFVLPRLASVYSSLKIELPLITKILIAVGQFIDKYGAIAIPALIGLMFLIIYLLGFNKTTKHVGQYIALKTPIFRRVVQEIQVARFGYIVGSILKSGITVDYALSSLVESTTNIYYQKFYKHLEESILEGSSFQKSFDQYNKIDKLFPIHVQYTVSAAEKSGELPGSLLKISEMYEKKIDITTKDLTALLEPTLLIMVWIGVSLIAFAVILPIYSLIDSFSLSQ